MGLVRRILTACPYAPWFSAAALAALVAVLLVQRACYLDEAPLGIVRTVEPLERYDPDYLHEIPMTTTWRVTGEVKGVPTVEPADQKTREQVREIFGEDADKVDFLYVGEVGDLPHGADVYVVQDREPPAVDIGAMPVGVPAPEGSEIPFAVGPPARLIIRAKPTPRVDLRKLYRVEAWREWEPGALQDVRWAASFRPWELWLKGRVYGFLELGYHQAAGESGAYGRAGVGLCPGRDCR